MSKNMGRIDRIVRLAIAVVVGYLYFAGQIHGALAIALGVVAVIFLLTAIFSRCPIYRLLGLSTCKCGDEPASNDKQQPPVVPA